ncbi:peroxiredoxin-like family protein [Flavobacterium sp. K5-23]|uniref:peroxiredoxin-like family protein n=1 Tax=Flavobacterium sp. K5-23 TaxID=2746225 RepID=UPI00200BB1FB|nr:peroxiredoxin-like family protein [Flavobacterium sp. K5-23]UQD56020.1 AhpC/TSA family protein [Flavobacterium sp. K5-23]
MKKLLCIALMAMGSLLHAQNDLPKSATDVSPLLIGEKISDITLKSVEDKDVNTASVFSKKKTVLVFYRGGWCPYCNKHLSALGEAEATLLELGYQIVAISPDAPKNLKATIEKDKVNYTLLSDSKGDLAKEMGIAFQAPSNYQSVLSKGSDGLNSSYLPVPSVFIVNLEGEIEFEYITPDYKHRLSNELLIAVAKALKK